MKTKRLIIGIVLLSAVAFGTEYVNESRVEYVNGDKHWYQNGKRLTEQEFTNRRPD